MATNKRCTTFLITYRCVALICGASMHRAFKSVKNDHDVQYTRRERALCLFLQTTEKKGEDRIFRCLLFNELKINIKQIFWEILTKFYLLFSRVYFEFKGGERRGDDIWYSILVNGWGLLEGLAPDCDEWPLKKDFRLTVTWRVCVLHMLDALGADGRGYVVIFSLSTFSAILERRDTYVLKRWYISLRQIRISENILYDNKPYHQIGKQMHKHQPTS